MSLNSWKTVQTHKGCLAFSSSRPELGFRALPLTYYLLVSCVNLGKLLNLQAASLLFIYTLEKRIYTLPVLGELNEIM